ncbi:hypothetical protein V8C43DRAFT_282903 [Trichoderma afarasin]
MTLPLFTVLVTFGFNPFTLLFSLFPAKAPGRGSFQFRLKRHLLASHRIVSYRTASPQRRRLPLATRPVIGQGP